MGIGITRNFDKTAECLEDGGEVSDAIKQLYAACERHNVPLFGAVVAVSDDDQNHFSAFQVAPDKELPVEFVAAALAIKNDVIPGLILTMAAKGGLFNDSDEKEDEPA